MSVNAGMLSSERSDWETPDDLFKVLRDEFRFTVDAAATEANSKCEEFFGPPPAIQLLYTGEAGARAMAIEAKTAGKRGEFMAHARSLHRELLVAQRNSLAEAAWDTSTFLNPPYGDELPIWLEKAVAESRRGCTVVALVPARTDTSWWIDQGGQAHERREIRGRLTFKGAPAPAPFPSAVLVFRPPWWREARRLTDIGTDGKLDRVLFGSEVFVSVDQVVDAKTLMDRQNAERAGSPTPTVEIIAEQCFSPRFAHDAPPGAACPYWLDMANPAARAEAKCAHPDVTCDRTIPDYAHRPDWCPLGAGALTWRLGR